MFKSIVTAIALFVSATSASAAVKMLDEHTLQVSGNTTQRMAQEVVKQLALHDVKRIVMWGNGGDAFAGLAIGAAIHNEGVTLQIPSGTRCISACAFAALAADKIMLGGELWFHHAYRPMVPTSKSLEDLEREGQKIGAITLFYGHRIEVPAQFIYEVIATTSSCKFLVVDKSSSIRTIINTKDFENKTFRYSRRYNDEFCGQDLRR
jgi:hypothetical protein